MPTKKALQLQKDDAKPATRSSPYVKEKQYDDLTVLLKQAEIAPDVNNRINWSDLRLQQDYENAIASYKSAIDLKADHAVP